MPLFSMILDYHGGNYFAQVHAPNEISAVAAWVGAGGFDAPAEAVSAIAEEQLPEVVALEGMQSAWCCTAAVSRDLVLLNIVRTA